MYRCGIGLSRVLHDNRVLTTVECIALWIYLENPCRIALYWQSGRHKYVIRLLPTSYMVFQTVWKYLSCNNLHYLVLNICVKAIGLI